MAPGELRRVPARCDGQQLARVVEAATAWLQAHAAEVDALNVYPVPDGDTGSNMSQTLRAAADAAAGVAAHQAGQYAAQLAHGALMGARGNSGVILSQLLRGFARVLDGQRTFTAEDLVRALQEASAAAYRAVIKPVEGTVLTVARVAAEQAARAAEEQPDFVHVLSAAVSAGRRALAETRTQLAALRQAGVVDAGAAGYMLILEGALRYLQGKEMPHALGPVPASNARARAAVHAQIEHGESAYGYCTEFLLAGKDLPQEMIRETLARLGDSLLVVGEPHVLRVHIHTDDPGRAMSYAGGFGRLRQVKVQDMQEQHDEFADEVQTGAPPAPADLLPVGLVAVAAGEGLARVLASLGARIVPGGQTMNPSTRQILAAIDDCPQDTVIVLPNNGNVVLTAQQAAGLSSKTVHVIPTETIPQGIAALLALRPDEQPRDMLIAMREAAGRVRTVELTTAVRDAEMDGIEVRRGDTLGLLDGKIVAAGADLAAVLTDLLERMPADRYELVTVYTGADATPEATAALGALLARRYPELQVETLSGGQPHYQFVLAVE